jgi:signal transduction histidine kinase
LTVKKIEEMSLDELEYSMVVGGGRSILIVDDEAVIHEVLKQFLEDCGYQIDSVLSGEDAVDKVKTCEYNLLLVDKNLPGISGIEVMQHAREIRPELEFILITAYASYESAVEALRLGAFDYIEKPFTNHELIKEKVHKALERQSMAHENQILADELRQAHINKQEQKSQNPEPEQAKFIQCEKMAAFGQLGAGIIHEVKNPMTGIVGFAQVGQTKVDNPDKARDLFARIEREAVRCKEILSSFLKFARSDNLKMADIDLNQAIEEASKIFGHTLTMHKVKLDIQLAKDLPRVKGNSGQLQQVLLNLAMNAQQAMPAGGQVVIRTSKNNEGSAVITVSDNGPGIDEEVLCKIFEPFFTTKNLGEGTGLGLAISREIIRYHQGRLTVKSEVGKGTRFSIKLPSCNEGPSHD